MKILLLFLVLQCVILAQDKQYFGAFDWFTTELETIVDGFLLSDSLQLKDELTCEDMLEMYKAEISFGKFNVWMSRAMYDSLSKGLSPKTATQYEVNYIKCVKYISKHKPRFRMVYDGWKGDDNFWEPNNYWAEKAKQIDPKNEKTLEICFDLDFKNLYRKFSFTDCEACFSCEKFYKNEVFQHKTLYLSEYSEKELSNYVSNCKKRRKKFEEEKNKLLIEYNFSQFTDKLKNIDSSRIILPGPID